MHLHNCRCTITAAQTGEADSSYPSVEYSKKFSTSSWRNPSTLPPWEEELVQLLPSTCWFVHTSVSQEIESFLLNWVAIRFFFWNICRARNHIYCKCSACQSKRLSTNAKYDFIQFCNLNSRYYNRDRNDQYCNLQILASLPQHSKPQQSPQ